MSECPEGHELNERQVCVLMGEFKKRIKKLMYEDKTIDDGNDVLFIIDEAKQDIPNAKRIVEAKTMIEKLFPDSHGFSKRYVQKVLTDMWDARVKWFDGYQEDQKIGFGGAEQNK